jgi:hypothetical protein
VDGEAILLLHEWSGVEIGHSGIFSEGGEARKGAPMTSIVTSSAENGARLARFDKLPKPPLPEIDEEATAHTNEVLRAARERMPEFDVKQK